MAVKTTDMRKVSRISSARTRQKFINWGLNVITWVLIFIILIPIIFMVVGSFKSRGEFTSPVSPIFPEVWHPENYVTMWNQIKFGELFKNSIIVTGLTTLVATFFAALGGYALARFRFPGADTFGLAVLGTQLIPGTLFFIPLYLMFLSIKNNLGVPLVGNNLGAIILYIGFFTPISLWILRGFFASIPPDLEEQAMVDGTTRFGAFWRISLPLAGPGITSTAIYIFMTAWNELFFGYTLGVVTVPVGIRQFVFGASGTQLRYDLMAAASVVITIPLAIMFLVLQKQFIQGLTAGAVK